MYDDGLPLANITIAGIKTRPSSVSINSGSQNCNTAQVSLEKKSNILYISNLETAMAFGAWNGDLVVRLE